MIEIYDNYVGAFESEALRVEALDENAYCVQHVSTFLLVSDRYIYIFQAKLGMQED
jgi:hypothetical protein